VNNYDSAAEANANRTQPPVHRIEVRVDAALRSGCPCRCITALLRGIDAAVTTIVTDYIMHTLDLKKETAGYVTMVSPEKLTYLTPEDGERYGIEFTRMNMPGYDLLP
jgi:hypothetical protein